MIKGTKADLGGRDWPEHRAVDLVEAGVDLWAKEIKAGDEAALRELHQAIRRPADSPLVSVAAMLAGLNPSEVLERLASLAPRGPKRPGGQGGVRVGAGAEIKSHSKRRAGRQPSKLAPVAL